MPASEWTEYLSNAKTVLDLFKGIRAELPKGVDTKKIEARIVEAETALKTTEAELAKKLGYRICRCTFPPQIMLWKQEVRKDVCSSCGNTYPSEPRPQPDRPLSALTRSRHR